ncbi:MAG TPA: SpoIIE family protein phosphatase [Desulfuromonadaceae bacterium]
MEVTRKILIVDDEDLIRKILRGMCEAGGFCVVEAANGREGLEVFAREAPDIILTDLIMPVMNGLTFIALLRETSPATPIVVISGTGSITDAIEAIHLGAWDYVTKPVVQEECLEIVLKRVLERMRLIAENKAYQEHLEELVRQRTEDLRDSEARFRTLFESANDAIILIRDGRIISCNQSALELFGCSQHEVADRTIPSFSPLRQPGGAYSEDMLKERMTQALAGEPQSYEWRYVRHDGSTFDAEISLNRLELHGDLYLQAIMRDITERKRAARALLDNARLTRELEIAQEIQKSLLPDRAPELAGLQVACSWVPAAHVGGDYYDFFSPEPHLFDVVIADVAGHNFGSALMMTEARSALHARVAAGSPPGDVLTSVNELLYNDLCRAELQLSMFYARLDTRSRMLSYANAGHSPPLLYRLRDGAFMELDAEGMLMGIRLDVSFEERTAALEAGDIMLLYTDGVTEAENGEGEFFGAGRLCDVICHHHHYSPDEIMAAIFRHLADFTGTKPISDDLSLVILKGGNPPSGD